MPVREHPAAKVYAEHGRSDLIADREKHDADANRKLREVLDWLNSNPHPDLRVTYATPYKQGAPVHQDGMFYGVTEMYGVHVLVLAFPFWMANPPQPASTPES